MKLKKFNEYASFYSKDPRNFEKKVAFASSEDCGVDVFKKVNDSADIKFSMHDTPIILWNNFDYSQPSINESTAFVFNSKRVPRFEEVSQEFETEPFLPKTVHSRKEVKRLKFPITGVAKDSTEDFKTYGKFKKSEKSFSKFREKITPRTRFDVLAFKSEPIHIQERINQIGFDVDPDRFKYYTQVESIVEKIKSRYPLDFYHICLTEADGKLYLDDITTSTKLSPSQSIKMYETAYSDYYAAKLPNWFKTHLFESYVKPYYKKRYYDAALIKPKHSIDFKKHIGL
jgi:hypothetical protein